MKIFNSKGYATILTIITIGILGIVIFGLLNLFTLNHKMIHSNESSIKAYYIGESGITVLKNEIDAAFEEYLATYIDTTLYRSEEETILKDEKSPYNESSQSFKEFVMTKEGLKDLQGIRVEEEVFEFYKDLHSWRLEVIFDTEDIVLYSTGNYREARKRIVAIISYPDVHFINGSEGNRSYRYIPSEILVYYQGYEGEYVD